MNPQFWRFLFAMSVVFVLLLGLSFLFVVPGSDSYYVAVVSLVLNVAFLVVLAILIRKEVTIVE